MTAVSQNVARALAQPVEQVPDNGVWLGYILGILMQMSESVNLFRSKEGKQQFCILAL